MNQSAVIKAELETKTLDKVNYLNIFLMFGSLGLALVLPFELFLLAYAILGPLHYLTEISWLHNRNYFLKSKVEIGFFLLVGFVLMGSEILGFLKIRSDWMIYLAFAVPTLIFAAFVYALGALFLKRAWQKIVLFVLAVLVAVLLNWSKDLGFYVFFAVLLPTFIHVYIFTGAFILYGALKARSRSAILSLLVFLICPLIALLVPVVVNGSPTDFVSQNLPFYFSMHQTLATILHFGAVGKMMQIFSNPAAIALMRVIAFAYTYHYLNWFSKTSVIKWQKVSRWRWAGMVVFWLTAVGLYMWNYALGFTVLFLLSMLHVFLEFPLNWVSLVGIGKESWGLVKPAAGEFYKTKK